MASILFIDGQIAFDSGGNIRFVDEPGDCECCGGGGGEPICCTCSIMPSTITVVISGNTICTGCMDDQANFPIANFSQSARMSGDINGTYELTPYFLDPCTYQFTGVGGGTMREYYESRTCSGAHNQFTNISVQAFLGCNDDGDPIWTVVVIVGALIVFQGVTPAVPNCLTEATADFVNSPQFATLGNCYYARGGGFPSGYGGEDGIAFVTPNP